MKSVGSKRAGQRFAGLQQSLEAQVVEATQTKTCSDNVNFARVRGSSLVSLSFGKIQKYGRILILLASLFYLLKKLELFIPRWLEKRA